MIRHFLPQFLFEAVLGGRYKVIELTPEDQEELRRVREEIREIFCRQCDGISHADTCELDKGECPVLKTAPDQILKIKGEPILTMLWCLEKIK